MRKNIFAMKQIYNKNYDTFCYQNCLKYVLEAYGVNNADFYVNKTLSLILKTDSFFSLDIRYDDAARSLLPMYDDKVRRYFPAGKSKEEVLTDNLLELNKGNLLVVGVDSFYLSYMPYYKKSHGRHTLILSGCDQKRNIVSVIDWIEPWCYKGVLHLDEFLIARDSSNEYDGGFFSGLPIENNWAELDDFGWDEKRNVLIMQTLDVSIKQYFIDSSLKNEKNGIYALFYICEQLMELEKISDNEQEDYLKKLHKMLFIANKRKIFFDDFLLRVEKDYCKVAIAVLDKINQEWEKFLYKVIKLTMRRKPGYSIELANKLNMLIEDELKLYAELVKIINCI